MYTGIKHLHSFFAYILLAAIIFSLGYAIYKFVTKSPFDKSAQKMSMVGFIASHLQFLIGLIVYVVSPVGITNFSGEAMGDSLSRLYLLEHPLMMILGVVLISFGYVRAKKPGDDARRYKIVIIYYTLGLIAILSRIPWQVWPT
ncbi:MAG: hypothetical protein GVY08_14825 [Bacteroidetes bacterium]|jgi:hypothetical protein|nr:hypothetical protein [Bacteroidota bacterium]